MNLNISSSCFSCCFDLLGLLFLPAIFAALVSSLVVVSLQEFVAAAFAVVVFEHFYKSIGLLPLPKMVVSLISVTFGSGLQWLAWWVSYGFWVYSL